ncbi:MAG TPA: hypothetical protein VFT67_08970 [Jatrophihabitantaceae bacterium]|nr:hypothetical protein [Jatrophihabitantaceae bacterium]
MSALRRAPLGPSFRRPELIQLDTRERERVRALVRSRRMRCPACDGRRFEVGDTLYLGFLFVDTDLDEYMVALTCTNPRCPAPRTGVQLREHEFLEHQRPREKATGPAG